MGITAEYLFQIIGEITVENRTLRQELAKLQKQIIDSKEPVKEKDNG